MPEFTRGKVRFVYRRIGRVTGAEDEVERYSCLPLPNGSRRGANPVLTIPAHHDADHLQDAESERIIAFTAGPGMPQDMPTILSDIAANFRFRPLTINLAGIPAAWRRVEPCFDTVISVVVESVIVRIDVIPWQEVSHDGVTWPVGDPVATLRFIVPDRYRFRRRKTHNPECCPGHDGETPPPPSTESDDWSDHNFVAMAPPRDDEIEEIIVTGRRRRADLDDRPIPITPITPEDLMDPGTIPPNEGRDPPRIRMDEGWLDEMRKFKPLPLKPGDPDPPGKLKSRRMEFSPFWLSGKVRYWF